MFPKDAQGPLAEGVMGTAHGGASGVPHERGVLGNAINFKNVLNNQKQC